MYSHDYKVLYIAEEQNEYTEEPDNEYLKYNSNDAGGHDIILFDPDENDFGTPASDDNIILEVDMVDILKQLGPTTKKQQNAFHENIAETAAIDIQLPIQKITITSSNEQPMKDNDYYLALADKISEIERQHDEIKKMMKKELTDDDDWPIHGLKLPFKTTDDLNTFEKLLAEDDGANKYIWKKALKSKWKGSVRDSLPLIIATELVLKYNWDGSFRLGRLSSFKLFTEILYAAWKTYDLEYDEYVQEVKLHVTCVKKRNHGVQKRKAIRLKKLQLLGVADQTELEPSADEKMPLTTNESQNTQTQYSKLLQQINKVRIENEEIKNCIKTMLEKGTRSMEFYSFPLSSAEDLNALEQIVKDERNKRELIKLLKTINDEPFNQRPSYKVMRLIATDRFFMEYSWLGDKQKQKLSEVALFKSILFDAWKSHFDGDYNTYEDFINQYCKRARVRYYDTQPREKPLRGGGAVVIN